MKRGKILVADDNQGIRSALKILLPMHFGEVELIATLTAAYHASARKERTTVTRVGSGLFSWPMCIFFSDFSKFAFENTNWTFILQLP